MPSPYYPYMSRAKEAKKQKKIITPDLRLVFHRISKTKRTKLILQPQPPPQALRFSHGRGERETRVTGDEPQGTMGRVQTAGEAFAKPRCVLPAFLCAYIFIKRETSGYEAATALVGKSNGKDTITTHFDWKKQKRILLVDRWEDQTAREDTTATLQAVAQRPELWKRPGKRLF